MSYSSSSSSCDFHAPLSRSPSFNNKNSKLTRLRVNEKSRDSTMATTRTVPQQLEIGFVFEYASKNPIFGVLNFDIFAYAPLLGFFIFTGILTFVFLWFKSVKVANKEVEEQDRRDL